MHGKIAICNGADRHKSCINIVMAVSPSGHTRLTFKGRLQVESFTAFAHHRAGRLGLRIDIVRADDRAITVDVAGLADMVDAFEMACSLGPYDCLVLDVARDARPHLIS